MLEFFYNLGYQLYALIVNFAESVDLIFRGWAALPGQLYGFVAALGPVGSLLAVVVGTCVGYLVLRLIIIIVELIPGF